MNLTYTIMKGFEDASYQVTFEITDYSQICVYDKDNKKYYEVSILFHEYNNNYFGQIDFKEEQPLSFSEIYNKWCERCHQVLKEREDSFEWWMPEGACNANFEKYDKIVKEQFCK